MHETFVERTFRDRPDGDHSFRSIPSTWRSGDLDFKEHCSTSPKSGASVSAGHRRRERLGGRGTRQDWGLRQLSSAGQSSDKMDRRLPDAEGQECEQSGCFAVQDPDGDIQKGVHGCREGTGGREFAPLSASPRRSIRGHEQQATRSSTGKGKRQMEDRPKCEKICKDRSHTAVTQQTHRAKPSVLPVVREEPRESHAGLDHSSKYLKETMSSPEFTDVLRVANRPRAFCLEIFAGTGRLSIALKKVGITCFPIDTCIFPSHNVLLQDVEYSIQNFIRSGKVKFVWLGMPCTTFSRARKYDGVGPGPLRTDGFIWGLPSLCSRDQHKLRQGNELFLFSLRILKLCDRLHIPFIIENPFGSMAWEVPSMRRFIESFGSLERNLDFCMFGELWKKPTKLVFKYLCLDSIGLRCNSSSHICSQTGQPHVPLKGLADNGKFMTLVAQPQLWQSFSPKHYVVKGWSE